MSGPESPERLNKVRNMIERLITGIEGLENIDEKLDSIRQGLELRGLSWDLDEGSLWADMLDYVENGGQLTDSYLILWRRQYRAVLGID